MNSIGSIPVRTGPLRADENLVQLLEDQTPMQLAKRIYHEGPVMDLFKQILAESTE